MAQIGPQLQAVFEGFKKNVPDVISTPFINALADFTTTFDTTKTINVGDTIPAFSLPNAVGERQSSGELLSRGPLIITFYRGEWCPYCNIAISGYQKIIDQITAAGATVVAISPEVPNENMSISEKYELKFLTLTDLHNEYASKLNIVWKQPSELKPLFESFGIDLVARNKDDPLVLPVPATLLVNRSGVVVERFVDPNYTKRVEPQVVLEWLKAL